MRQRISKFFGSCFANVKHLLWLPAVLVLTFATCVHANPIPTFNVTSVIITLLPCASDGGCLFLTYIGPGLDVAGDGTADECRSEWCSGLAPGNDFGITPGQTFSPGSPGPIIVEDIFTAVVDGTALDPFTFNFDPSDVSLNLGGSFTFPSNAPIGSSFNACVPGSTSVPPASVAQGNALLQFNMSLPNGGEGQFCSTWTLEDAGFPGTGPQYFFDSGQLVMTATPEPAPLLLLATGLLAFPFARRFFS